MMKPNKKKKVTKNFTFFVGKVSVITLGQWYRGWEWKGQKYETVD